jgi:hypothetical protein
MWFSCYSWWFFLKKRHLRRGLRGGQRGEPGFEPWTGCYSWWLPPPKRAACVIEEDILVFVLCLWPVDIVRGFDPTSLSANGYSSGMCVASWSGPFD